MIPFDWSYKSLIPFPMLLDDDSIQHQSNSLTRRVDEICRTLVGNIVGNDHTEARSYTSEIFPPNIHHDTYTVAWRHLEKNLRLFEMLSGTRNLYEFHITHDRRIQVNVTQQEYVFHSKKRSYDSQALPVKTKHKNMLQIGIFNSEEDLAQAKAIFKDRIPYYEIDMPNLSELRHSANSEFQTYVKENKTHYLFCCRIDDEIVGALYAYSHSLTRNSNLTTMYVKALAIKNGFEGRKMGSTLLTKLIRLAEEIGCDTVSLESMTETLPFYKKYGFKIENLPSLGNLEPSEQALIEQMQQKDRGSLNEVERAILKSVKGLANAKTSSLRNYHEKMLKLLMKYLNLSEPIKFERFKHCRALFHKIFKLENCRYANDQDLWNLFEYILDHYIPDNEYKLTKKLLDFAVTFNCPNVPMDRQWKKEDFIYCCEELENLNISIRNVELTLTRK